MQSLQSRCCCKPQKWPKPTRRLNNPPFASYSLTLCVGVTFSRMCKKHSRVYGSRSHRRLVAVDFWFFFSFSSLPPEKKHLWPLCCESNRGKFPPFFHADCGATFLSCISLLLAALPLHWHGCLLRGLPRRSKAKSGWLPFKRLSRNDVIRAH